MTSRQGTLTTLGVYEAMGLVHCPDELSFEEAATLPCAAVTAWSGAAGHCAAHRPRVRRAGRGDGRRLRLRRSDRESPAGSRVIATSSSSDDKLRRLQAAWACPTSDLINYSQHKDWAKEVRKLVPNGVDHVVEVAGQLKLALNSVKPGGVVNNIGYVDAGEGVSCQELLFAAANVRSTAVGSRHSFIQLLKAFKGHGIKPVIDRVFSFEEAKEALKYMEEGSHVGKIVIKVGDTTK